MSTNRIYVAFCGEWEERSCVGVYATRAAAEFACRYRGDDQEHDIEEFTLGELPSHQPGLLPFRVWVSREGRITGCCAIDGVAVKPPYELAEYVGPENDRCVDLWARDTAHAIRGALRLRDAVLASGQGWGLPERLPATTGVVCVVTRADLAEDSISHPHLALGKDPSDAKLP